ncbi:unnamed protein product [Orchesella dallaii]|uniref:Uncharacterized protein n=1 Tax=Orchesella dallaii TaxID=48710 RepID=A0ABP1QAQ5_9HEXA
MGFQGFGIGYINVQILYQKLLRFDMPFVYSSHSAALIPNPKLKNRRQMPLWIILNSIMIGLWIYCIFHLGRLLKQAEKVSKVDAEQLIAYWFYVATFAQQLISAYTFERDPVSVTRMVSQTFHLSGIKDVGLPTPERLLEFPEIFCYIVAGGFLCFPSIFVAIPLLRSYDPISIHMKYFIPSNLDKLRRILASICYFIITFLTMVSCSSYILLAMSTTHAFETLTKRLLTMTNSKRYTKRDHNESELWKRLTMRSAEKLVNISQPLIVRLNSTNGIVLPFNINDAKEKDGPQFNQLFHRPNFSISSAFKQNGIYPNQYTNTTIMKDLKEYTIPQAAWNDSSLRVQPPKYSSIEKFRRVHFFHNQVQMLITVSNKSVEAFVPVMNGVGMSICMVLSVAIIKIFNVLPTLTGTKALYAFLGIVTFGTVIAIMLGLITFFFKHASEPSLYSRKYINYWRNQPLPSLRRRQARAMSEIAFNIGPFGKSAKRGALSEMQKISEFTITLLLGLD